MNEAFKIRSNGQDPVTKAFEDKWHQLFNQWSKSADSIPTDVVLGATLNMLLVCLRNAHGDRRQAEVRFDEIMYKTKSLLMDHYDPVTGKRMNVFPFTQYITPNLHVDKDRKN